MRGSAINCRSTLALGKAVNITSKRDKKGAKKLSKPTRTELMLERCIFTAPIIELSTLLKLGVYTCIGDREAVKLTSKKLDRLHRYGIFKPFTT